MTDCYHIWRCVEQEGLRIVRVRCYLCYQNAEFSGQELCTHPPECYGDDQCGSHRHRFCIWCEDRRQHREIIQSLLDIIDGKPMLEEEKQATLQIAREEYRI